MLDSEGQPFRGMEEDEALFDAIRGGIDLAKSEVVEMACHINDPQFALAMAQRLASMLNLK